MKSSSVVVIEVSVILEGLSDVKSSSVVVVEVSVILEGL